MLNISSNTVSQDRLSSRVSPLHHATRIDAVLDLPLNSEWPGVGFNYKIMLWYTTYRQLSYVGGEVDNIQTPMREFEAGYKRSRQRHW